MPPASGNQESIAARLWISTETRLEYYERASYPDLVMLSIHVLLTIQAGVSVAALLTLWLLEAWVPFFLDRPIASVTVFGTSLSAQSI